MSGCVVPESEIARQYSIAESVRPMVAGTKACIITFGCQQNEADSERIAGALRLCGYEMTESPDEAKLIIINTCAVREHAEIRALSEAGQFKNRKERERDLKIGLCGCMAQQAHRREQIYKSYPYVDFVFGTDMHHRVPEIIKTMLGAKKRFSFISEKPHGEFGVVSEGMPVLRESGYRAWVSAMYGCDNFCTYCVVPHARGHERSRAKEDVLYEAKSLVESGYKDITLLGQNVNSYKGGCSFAELLDAAASFGGEYRVRFMTSHPKDASSELVDVIAHNPNVAHHFHLPVQSGADRVLKLMNRRYTRAQYVEKAREIKEKIKDVSLTTDIICGFPGETDADFEQTLSLVREIGFDMIFTFIYSPRPGTAAAKMEGQTPRAVSNARFAALSEAENAIAQSINDKYLGKTLRVLSDGMNKNGVYAGRSTQNKIVTFDKPVPAGEFTNVKIITAGGYALSGEVTE
ncbi:MAG: tRNA (N6-isopentenyl adenosine(37)-C2)-methylthiotransferase MiaB [Clostridia bacterium]|nr:tRNA (N6-isopentenyl adenosine(37)-C2)-methylthiotransferase MiaB [Clostridia bacterium]